MKRIFSMLIIVLLIHTVSKSQYVTLPNDSFRAFLISKYPACFNAAQALDTTCTAIITEDSLIFHGITTNSNYAALAYFDGLKYLDCSNNYFDATSVLPARLPLTITNLIANNLYGVSENLDIVYTNAFISKIPQGLQHFEYSKNSFSYFASVPWPASLKYLDISYNRFNGNAGILTVALDTFICSNQIRNNGLAVGPLTSFTSVLPASLKYFDCSANTVGGLPLLPPSLTYLDFSSQNLFFGLSGNVPVPAYANVPVLPASLLVLKCSKNRMTSLPVLPATLQYLDCSQQKYYAVLAGYGTFDYPGISSLPALPQSLNYLNCSNNPIPCLPELPAAMTGNSIYNNSQYNLEVTSTNIACLPNYIPGIQIHPYLQICNPSVPTSCQQHSVLKGLIFIDSNNNGVQDAGEFPAGFVKLDLSNNTSTFSDANGHYEFAVPVGINEITVVPPVYYSASPTSISHTIINTSTVINDTIALHPIGIHDSIQITITASQNPRANGSLFYTVNYQNLGTTTINPVITMNFDQLLHYQSSSNAAVIQSGNTLTLAAGNLAPGQQGTLYSYFIVPVSAPSAYHINSAGHAIAGTSHASDSSTCIVVASADPNDKQATPMLAMIDIASGRFIDYLVRFQNIGTASAINVFITDNLDAALQEGTLELIATSHTGTVTRSGNQLLCKFININLPASSSSEPASHGFVRFRVKPALTTPTNTLIPNRASIYFDYNAAVITNTANTLIAFGPIPLTLLDFNGKVQSSNNVLLKWQTANENNANRFEVEQSRDGRIFSYIVYEPAIGTGGNSYSKSVALAAPVVFYRLKMIDNDRNYRYSPIIRLYGGKTGAGLIVLNNPVKKELNIRLANNSLLNTTASFFNNQGLVVKTFLLTGNLLQFDVSNMATGVYYIKTSIGTEKIVVTR